MFSKLCIETIYSVMEVVLFLLNNLSRQVEGMGGNLCKRSCAQIDLMAFD